MYAEKNISWFKSRQRQLVIQTDPFTISEPPNAEMDEIYFVQKRRVSGRVSEIVKGSIRFKFDPPITDQNQHQQGTKKYKCCIHRSGVQANQYSTTTI